MHACKVELGYVISRKYWGCGLITLAVRLAIHHDFKDLNVDRIEALVDPVYAGSQRVFEKNNLFEKVF